MLFRRALPVVFAFVATAGAAHAQVAPVQAAPARPGARDEQLCLGFSFGTWKPALNWKAAGHGDMPDSARHLRAPAGRDWAVTSDALAGEPDSLLILFPVWWPAGVAVDLPTRSPASGDTVTGQAVAFRANADSVSPRTRVRAWRVACGGPPR